MLLERSSLRSPTVGAVASPVTWIVGVMVVTYAAQMLFEHWFESDWLTRTFALTSGGAKAGFVWTFVTYSFLHSTATLLHLVGCAVGVFLVGRQLLPHLGSRRFAGLYAGAVMLGGIVWLATNVLRGGLLCGAAPGCAGLLTMFACLFPSQQMKFLLFFVLPITLKPKHFVFGLLLVDGAGFLFYEMLGQSSPLGWAHSADLGGMLAGFLYHRLVHAETFKIFGPGNAASSTIRSRRMPPVSENADEFGLQINPQDDLRGQVDAILDKINSQGFGSLTDAERRVLEEAKDLMDRR